MDGPRLATLGAWLSQRLGLDIAHDTVMDRRVPKVPWYQSDGVVLMTLVGTQFGTGGLLALSYAASPDSAYESLRYITHEQPLGWFVRGLHYWTAGGIVVVLLWHLFRHILIAGYKKPREGTWFIGVFMLFVVLAMSLTGYMLRGDETALYAFRVVANGVYNLPLIGEPLVQVLQGGYAFGSQTVARIFGTHAVLLPMILGVTILVHLYLVVVFGVTSPIERRRPPASLEHHEELYTGAKESEVEGEMFWPDSVADSMRFSVAVFVLVVLVTLTFGPAPLDAPWNVTEDAFPREEWWFNWFSTMAAYLPPAVAPVVYVLLPFAVGGALLALPFVARGPARGMRRRPFAVVAVVAVVGALFYATDLRRRSPWTAWPVDEPPTVPAGVTLTPTLELGRQRFSTLGCNTCHPVAGHGPRQFGPDLARIEPPYSYEALVQIVLEPPPSYRMPGYRGRITEEDLDLVVQYVLAAQTFPREAR